MAICRIEVETCAGGELKDVLRQMADMAERYNVPVDGDINGVRMVVAPDRVDELYELLMLRMTGRDASHSEPKKNGGEDGGA
jgi:hypothetical protein